MYRVPQPARISRARARARFVAGGPLRYRRARAFPVPSGRDENYVNASSFSRGAGATRTGTTKLYAAPRPSPVVVAPRLGARRCALPSRAKIRGGPDLFFFRKTYRDRSRIYAPRVLRSSRRENGRLSRGKEGDYKPPFVRSSSALRHKVIAVTLLHDVYGAYADAITPEPKRVNAPIVLDSNQRGENDAQPMRCPTRTHR